MLFCSLYLASKIEEIEFSSDGSPNVEFFCKIIGEEKFCNPESKPLKPAHSIVLTKLEIFLVRALKFEFIVYTPFQLIDFMSQRVREHIPTLDHKLFSDYYVANAVKAFQIEYITFIYTPSQIALACADLALNEMGSKGEIAAAIDMVSFFPELEISVWDKEAEIKKHLSHYLAFKADKVQAIRKKVAQFHEIHPEFKSQT